MRNPNILQLFLIIQFCDWCKGLCNERTETLYDQGEVLKSITVCERVLPPFIRLEQYYDRNRCEYQKCVHELSITDSTIFVIPPSAFRNFSTVTVLQMGDLEIQEIKPGAFNSLPELKELYLPGNQLKIIGPGVFNSLANLEILDLSKNEIQNVSADSLIGMTNLKKLLLSSNLLTFFESGILDRNIMSLDHMDLSFNLLSHINISTVFILINNFDISNNNISELNFCPFDFISANISRNNIRFLNKLDCPTNFLIVRFDAGYNTIKELDSNIFSNLVDLEYLNLEYNIIEELSSSIFLNLMNLKHLNLQHNIISSIPTGVFSDLSNLTTLNLSHNQIQQFQHGTFENLETLQILDISHNKINTLGRCLHSLVKLKTLYMQDNQFASLKREKLSEDLPTITFISLEDNKFSCNELIDQMHTFKKNQVSVKHGNIKNTANIHGISCFDEEHFEIEPTNDEFKFENMVSKLLQLAGGDQKKHVTNDYFNNEFRNSDFYKYLETFHATHENEGKAVIDYLNNGFENSKFYKYMERLKNNEHSTFEYYKSMFEYFDKVFENNKFVKYMNNSNGVGDEMKNKLPNSSFDDYSKSLTEFTNVTFRNSEFNAQKCTCISDGSHNHGLLTVILILIVILVLLKVILIYTNFIKKKEKRDNMEFLKV